MTWQFWVQFSAVLIAIFLLLGLTEAIYRLIVREYRRHAVMQEQERMLMEQQERMNRITWRQR